MPLNHQWQSRIKSVEREYLAMHRAAGLYAHQALSDPTLLHVDLKLSEITLALDNLEGTYVIRLFAEFETAAREYWQTKWQTEPKTVGLIDGLAARCWIPDRQRSNVQRVREYRNSLVHEREDRIDPVPMREARSHLCHFFSYLPPQW